MNDGKHGPDEQGCPKIAGSSNGSSFMDDEVFLQAVKEQLERPRSTLKSVFVARLVLGKLS